MAGIAESCFAGRGGKANYVLTPFGTPGMSKKLSQKDLLQERLSTTRKRRGVIGRVAKGVDR